MTFEEPYPTDEHKEQSLSKQEAFKLRIKLEREEEARLLKNQQAEEALMRAMKTKKINQPEELTKAPRKKRTYKKKEKKDKEIMVVIKKEDTDIKISLPVYHTKIEVNEFNKFKVDYIKRQIYHCKDKKRKIIYENALTKYKM